MTSFNRQKFKEVLHYILHQCGTLDNVGKTVIWKILYFADFDHYEMYETSLTGEDYYKLTQGPGPSHFKEIITELKDEKLIREVRTEFHGHLQNKYVSFKKPELTTLNSKEKDFLDRTVLKLCNMNATQISEYSHLDMPWKSAALNEKLDYEMVFYRNALMSVRETEDD